MAEETNPTNNSSANVMPIVEAELSKTNEANSDVDTQQVSSTQARSANTDHEPSLAAKRHDPAYIAASFQSGEYPYKSKITRKSYETHKKELQVELLKVQKWVRESGEKIVVLFEGRDAAGRGGTIKRYMEHGKALDL